MFSADQRHDDQASVSTLGHNPGASIAMSSSAGIASNDDEAQSAYASLSVEDNAAELPLWGWRWLGRILVWHVAGGVIYIGPHWYCCIIMLAFILGVGGFYCSSAVQAGVWQLFGGILVTSLSTTTFLRCALANPGVLRASAPGAAVEEGPPEGDGGEPMAPLADTGVAPLRPRRHARRCATCNLTQP